MQKILIAILLLLCRIAFRSEAQSFQISGYAGYAIPTFLRVTNGEYRMSGNITTGIAASVTKRFSKGFAKNTFFEIQYNYQPSTLRYDVYNSDTKYELGNIHIHTLLAGVLKELNMHYPKFFGGVLLGLTIYDPDNYTNLTRFTFSIVAGSKIRVSRFAGFRLQAQLMLPVIYDEVYIGWEPGFGLTTGVASNGLVFSPQFAGGFYFNFGMLK